jgi:hypothetical protein
MLLELRALLQEALFQLLSPHLFLFICALSLYFLNALPSFPLFLFFGSTGN